MEAGDYVALAANPVGIVWRGAGHRVIKQGKAVQLDVDSYGELAFFCSGFEGYAEGPGGVCIEGFKLEEFFLERNFF